MRALMFAATLAATALAAPALAGTVEVRLTGVQTGGPVMVQLCSEAEGMTRCSRRARVEATGGSVVARFDNVPAGRYAASGFQDVNANGRLGFGMMGAPNEPWGYSRGARGVFGPPNFADAAVAIPATGAVVPVQLGL